MSHFKIKSVMNYEIWVWDKIWVKRTDITEELKFNISEEESISYISVKMVFIKLKVKFMQMCCNLIIKLTVHLRIMLSVCNILSSSAKLQHFCYSLKSHAFEKAQNIYIGFT